MLRITATDAWHKIHQGGAVGLLELSGVDNTMAAPALDTRKRETVAGLREQFAGFDRAQFRALPVMDAYVRYYRRYRKTYHVLQQIESIVLKGRSLPDISPLVDACFCAEVETLILTASHDVDQLVPPVVIDVSVEGDQMTQMNGTTRPIRANDMIMRDATGVSCSIIYGQDNVSPVTRASTHVLYVAYAPIGVNREAVVAHLGLIMRYIRLVCPQSIVEQNRVIIA